MDEIKHRTIDKTTRRDYSISSFQLSAGNINLYTGGSKCDLHQIIWCVTFNFILPALNGIYITLCANLVFHSLKGHQSNNRVIYCFLLLHTQFNANTRWIVWNIVVNFFWICSILISSYILKPYAGWYIQPL